MKKLTTLLSLIILSISSYAQIPNGGFESLNDWFTGNVALSTDHYPESVGNFSIKLENQLPVTSHLSMGFAVTGNTGSGCIPSFAITGHPTQLHGYYKSFPLNNDTMQVGLMLFKNGVFVAGAEFLTTSTVANWTSFSVPISPYVDADSATLTVAAFYNDTTCGMPAGPFGNSVFYLDNISFDNLITNVSSVSSANDISVFPNPFSNKLNITQTGKEINTLVIYDLLGQKIIEKTFTESTSIETDLYTNQVYLYKVYNAAGLVKTGRIVKEVIK